MGAARTRVTGTTTRRATRFMPAHYRQITPRAVARHSLRDRLPANRRPSPTPVGRSRRYTPCKRHDITTATARRRHQLPDHPGSRAETPLHIDVGEALAAGEMCRLVARLRRGEQFLSRLPTLDRPQLQ